MPLNVESIDPFKAALIVIDMENDFASPRAPFEVKTAQSFLPKLKEVILFCRTNSISVIYTTHGY